MTKPAEPSGTFSVEVDVHSFGRLGNVMRNHPFDCRHAQVAPVQAIPDPFPRYYICESCGASVSTCPECGERIDNADGDHVHVRPVSDGNLRGWR